MNKETLDEKILALRTSVLSNLLRKKKIKHSVPDLEKMVINKSDLSVYNYFSSRKNDPICSRTLCAARDGGPSS